MAQITLGGTPTTTYGNLPKVGTQAPSFSLTATDLSEKKISAYKGKRMVLNIFPSVDTGICATSSRKFNEVASSLNNTQVLCISKDLPFAQVRFCGAEGIENIEMLSDFKSSAFGKDYGVEILDGAFQNLHSRAIVVLDENHTVIYTEQVPEVGQEPNYEAALKHLN